MLFWYGNNEFELSTVSSYCTKTRTRVSNGIDIHIINQPKQLMVKGLTQEQLELGLERMESIYHTN